MVYKEQGVKTQGILVATCHTAVQKKREVFFVVLYSVYLQKFGVEVGRVVRPNV